MSVRYSIGLIPQGPCCRYHGRTMRKLKDKQPLPFLNGSTGNLVRYMKRTVWRCKVKGCPMVAASDMTYDHQPRELSLLQVNPW